MPGDRTIEAFFQPGGFPLTTDERAPRRHRAHCKGARIRARAGAGRVDHGVDRTPGRRGQHAWDCRVLALSGRHGGPPLYLQRRAASDVARGTSDGRAARWKCHASVPAIAAPVQPEAVGRRRRADRCARARCRRSRRPCPSRRSRRASTRPLGVGDHRAALEVAAVGAGACPASAFEVPGVRGVDDRRADEACEALGDDRGRARSCRPPCGAMIGAGGQRRDAPPARPASTRSTLPRSRRAVCVRISSQQTAAPTVRSSRA